MSDNYCERKATRREFWGLNYARVNRRFQGCGGALRCELPKNRVTVASLQPIEIEAATELSVYNLFTRR